MNRKEIEERFKAKNIDTFFERLFPFSTNDNAIIAAEVIRLCTAINHKYRIYFDEIEFLLDEACKRKAPTATETKTLLTKISKNKKITTHRIPVLVLSDLERVSYDKDKFDQYKALSLLVITRLTFIGRHESKIDNICNEIRQFSIGKRESLAGHLPDISSYAFPELIEQFNILTNTQTTYIKSSQIIEQLNHYRRPYRDSYNLSDGYTRSVTTKQFRQAGTLTVSPRQYLKTREIPSSKLSNFISAP